MSGSGTGNGPRTGEPPNEDMAGTQGFMVGWTERILVVLNQASIVTDFFERRPDRLSIGTSCNAKRQSQDMCQIISMGL